MTLGDLSVSQVAVLNHPIDLSDIRNLEHFHDWSSVETPHRPSKPRSKWYYGRMHKAIETGSELVIRTMLTMEIDIEELDLHSQTPLIHATMKY